MKRVRMNCIMVPGGILLLLVLLCGAVKSNPAQPADQETGDDAVLGTCILSGTVINFDTNEPIPYFCLLYTKGGGGGILEFLETDEKGHFRTTAPRGSERSLKLHQSSRGTYIIDWDQQMQILPRPFRGIVRDDMTDFIFKVKLWPVTTLTGKVLDESSQPAGNASVYFHHNVPEVKTDATGTFRLQTAPTDRNFDLFAISEDKNKAGFVHLKAGSTTATINLEPTESYNGRVIDTEGTPVGPFEFIVGLRLNGSNNDCLQQRLQADTDGTFTIDYLYPKMSYYFWWFPDEQVNRTLGEYGSKTIDLTKQNPNDDIEIVVEQYLNAVTGRILDTKGAPVKEAKVMVHTRHGIQAQYRRHKAVLSGLLPKNCTN